MANVELQTDGFFEPFLRRTLERDDEERCRRELVSAGQSDRFRGHFDHVEVFILKQFLGNSFDVRHVRWYIELERKAIL